MQFIVVQCGVLAVQCLWIIVLHAYLLGNKKVSVGDSNIPNALPGHL